MANVDVVNTDDDLVTFINSFTVPPTEEEIAENNTLKRSYDVLFNEQDDSISDAPKEKTLKMDFKVGPHAFMDMKRKIEKLRTSKRNMLIQIKDIKKGQL